MTHALTYFYTDVLHVEIFSHVCHIPICADLLVLLLYEHTLIPTYIIGLLEPCNKYRKQISPARLHGHQMDQTNVSTDKHLTIWKSLFKTRSRVKQILIGKNLSLLPIWSKRKIPVNRKINTVQSIQQRDEHWGIPEIPDTGTQSSNINGGHVKERKEREEQCKKSTKQTHPFYRQTREILFAVFIFNQHLISSQLFMTFYDFAASVCCLKGSRLH